MTRRRNVVQTDLPYRLVHEGGVEVTFLRFREARRAAEKSYERHGLKVEVYHNGKLVFFIEQLALPLEDQPMTPQQRAWVLKQRSHRPAHLRGT